MAIMWMLRATWSAPGTATALCTGAGYYVDVKGYYVDVKGYLVRAGHVEGALYRGDAVPVQTRHVTPGRHAKLVRSRSEIACRGGSGGKNPRG
eukprot:3421774-Pyramimonas_sp.AAC.1